MTATPACYSDCMDGFKLPVTEVWQSFYLINKCTNSVYCYLRVHCCVLKCLLHLPPLRQMNLVHTIPYCLFEIHFNIIQSAPWSSKWSLRGLGDTQRQAEALISGPCLGAKARFLSFNRTQSRAVIGFLKGHNTLRRHPHLLGLLDSPLCRRCGAEEETSAHVLCE